MLSREEATGLLTKWAKKLTQAIEEKEGEAICESTRMILFFVITLHTYFPDDLSCEIIINLIDSFKEAHDCVDEQLEANPDGCYDLYERNIRIRLDKLTDRWRTWWPVPAALV